MAVGAVAGVGLRHGCAVEDVGEEIPQVETEPVILRALMQREGGRLGVGWEMREPERDQGHGRCNSDPAEKTGSATDTEQAREEDEKTSCK